MVVAAVLIVIAAVVIVNVVIVNVVVADIFEVVRRSLSFRIVVELLDGKHDRRPQNTVTGFDLNAVDAHEITDETAKVRIKNRWAWHQRFHKVTVISETPNIGRL